MTGDSTGTAAAKAFSEMAERIGRNLPEEFGGAFVIVFPSGEIVSYAAFDPKPDDAAFGGLLEASVQTSIAQLMEREKKKQGFAGVRR